LSRRVIASDSRCGTAQPSGRLIRNQQGELPPRKRKKKKFFKMLVQQMHKKQHILVHFPLLTRISANN
jgi:hypothetical protein